MTMLILLNGPPGVGKSTLARRFVDDHPLTLLLEIDAIRVSLGGWQELEESRLIARALAVAMAEAHLRAGHDVIVPQFLGRVEFIEDLDQLAQRVGVDFREILLMDTEAAVDDRFRGRRAELIASGEPHPQVDVDESSVSAAVAESFERLESIQRMRTRVRVIVATDGLENAYRELCHILASPTGE